MSSPSPSPPPSDVRGIQQLRALPPLSPPLLYDIHTYNYLENGGTAASSRAFGVSEHSIIKTLLFQERDYSRPFVLLMHGDRSAAPALFRQEIIRTRGRRSGGLDTTAHRYNADAPKPHRDAGRDLGVKNADPEADEFKRNELVDEIEREEQFPDQVKKTKADKKSRVFMSPPAVADSWSGYRVGGTSPFGLKHPLRLFMEKSILDLDPVTESARMKNETEELKQKIENEIKIWKESGNDEKSKLIKWEEIDFLNNLTDDLLQKVTPALVLINAGDRGTLVTISVRDLVRLLQPVVISVGTDAKKKESENGKEAVDGEKNNNEEAANPSSSSSSSSAASSSSSTVTKSS